jgi:hypothetical protein
VGTTAILGTTSAFKGTSLADQSIPLNTGPSLEGRALASIAAVTLASTVITQPGSATSILDGARSSQLAIFQDSPGRGIAFTVPTSGRATLKLFSASGRQLAVLFDGHAESGRRNQSQYRPEGISRGLYFSKLESNGKIRLDKVLFGE